MSQRLTTPHTALPTTNAFDMENTLQPRSHGFSLEGKNPGNEVEH